MWEDYYGWGGPQQYSYSSQPPQYVLDQLGGSYDQSRYYWNPDTYSLVDRYNGGSYSYDRWDPATGSSVVTNYGNDAQQTINYGAGQTPYFGFGDSAQGYNGGDAPNSGMFISADPFAIDEYQSHRQDVVNQGIAQVGAVVGGAALGGALGGAGAATGDGLTTMTTGGASMLPGGTGAGVAAVNGALAGAPMASLPSFGALGGAGGAAGAGASAVGDGLSEITVGAQRLPGGINSLGGGGMWDNIMSGLGGNWGSLAGGLLGYLDARNQPDSMTTNQGGNSASQYFTTFPDEIAGPAREALASLRGLYGNGYQVAGADPASMAAISGLQGFAGGGGINPYLDSVFNSAADSTQTRLASEFARSGRNVKASAPARSEELQHLAAGIYGPGYDAERQRQFASLLPLLGAGDYMRGVQQQQMDAPYTGLERYLGGLGGLMPFFPGTQNQTTQQAGNVTQPLFNNPLAGFLGGAQLGSLFTNQG
jgi:hypothetical protein